MSDPIISPDGKWMWTGDEWIPAPPTPESTVDLTINDGDSKMSKNKYVEQYSVYKSSTINSRDGGIREGICPSCTRTKKNTDCGGCGENFCIACSHHPKVCDRCYKIDLRYMVNLKKDLRLHDRFWVSIGIGFFLQIPFSLSGFLFDPNLLGLFDVSDFLINFIWNIFAIILCVFWITYPGYLFFIRGVRPNDEKADQLSLMEQEYGKLKDLDVTLLEL